MKKRFSIPKTIRKGMTLLELVIAMALVSIVIAGAGVALFAMQRTANRETKNHTTLLEAKTLSYAIDQVIKGKRGEGSAVFVEDNRKVGQNGLGILFTMNDEEYGFDGKTFGLVEESKIEGENVIYTASNSMYITYSVQSVFEEIIIHYGDNYAFSYTLIERIA